MLTKQQKSYLVDLCWWIVVLIAILGMFLYVIYQKRYLLALSGGAVFFGGLLLFLDNIVLYFSETRWNDPEKIKRKEEHKEKEEEKSAVA